MLLSVQNEFHVRSDRTSLLCVLLYGILNATRTASGLPSNDLISTILGWFHRDMLKLDEDKIFRKG